MRQASTCAIGCSVNAVALCLGLCAEQLTLAVFGNAGDINVSAQRLGQRVMAWHEAQLAIFLVQ